MSLFNSGASQHSLRSLTADGSIAAVYPSEDQLWLYGPTFNEPGDQGYLPEGYDRAGGIGADASGQYPVIPTPRSAAELSATEDFLHWRARRVR